MRRRFTCAGPPEASEPASLARSRVQRSEATGPRIRTDVAFRKDPPARCHRQVPREVRPRQEQMRKQVNVATTAGGVAFICNPRQEAAEGKPAGHLLVHVGSDRGTITHEPDHVTIHMSSSPWTRAHEADPPPAVSASPFLGIRGFRSGAPLRQARQSRLDCRPPRCQPG